MEESITTAQQREELAYLHRRRSAQGNCRWPRWQIPMEEGPLFPDVHGEPASRARHQRPSERGRHVDLPVCRHSLVW